MERTRVVDPPLSTSTMEPPDAEEWEFFRERRACGADNDITDYASLPDVMIGGASR